MFEVTEVKVCIEEWNNGVEQLNQDNNFATEYCTGNAIVEELSLASQATYVFVVL